MHENARRDFLKKAAVGGAIAWTAPLVHSLPARAAGTCLVGQPTFESSATNHTGGTNALSVSGLTIPANCGAHIAVVAKEMNNTQDFGMTPVQSGWTQALGPSDSRVTTPNNNTTSNGFTLASNPKVRLWVWYRTSSLLSSYSFTPGGGGDGRLLLLVFSNVKSIASPIATEALAQGYGTDFGAGSATVTGPAIQTDGSVARSTGLWIGAWNNGPGNPAIVSTPPTSSTLLASQVGATFDDQLSVWAYSRLFPGPGTTLAASTATLNSARKNIGAQVTIEGWS